MLGGRDKSMAQTEEWLQNLKEKIVDEKDATNFDDIIKCYQNGLLRAGYLMAWLMLIESLKRKVIELEANGVKAAKVELAKIQQIENALQSNDEVIRKAALACDLISSEEAQVLDLLWKKRCIMSHPYMPEVKESDFRYMVENLVEITLGRELMWSQTMIDEYFETLKNSTFIIPDTLAEKKEAADKVLALIPEKNYPHFWKTVFFEFSTALENSTKKHHMMLRVLAMRFVEKDDVAITDSKYSLTTQIKRYCSVCWGIFYLRKTWDKLNEEFQGQMFRFLKTNKKEAKTVLYLAKNLIENYEGLKSEYKICYYSALKQYDVTDMERYYVDKSKFLKVLYSEKIEPNNFNDQGDFIDMLLSMDENDKDEYSADQLTKLGKWVETCCYVGTFKAQGFVMKDTIFSKDADFSKGVALEGLTDEDGSLYLSKRHLQYVMPVLFHTEDKMNVIEALGNLPVSKTVSDSEICEGIRTEIRKYIKTDSREGRAMKAVVDKYCKA